MGWENAGYKPEPKAKAEKNRKEARDVFGFNTKLEKIISGIHKGKYRILIKSSKRSTKKLKQVADRIKMFRKKPKKRVRRYP